MDFYDNINDDDTNDGSTANDEDEESSEGRRKWQEKTIAATVFTTEFFTY